MLSSPSSSYFLFNTPLMVTLYFSYNWKTKEKSKIKRGKEQQCLVMSRMALTPSKASPPGYSGVIPKKWSPQKPPHLTTLAVHTC